MAGPDPDIRRLLAWAAAKGIVLHPDLEVRGRTLTAVRNIEPGVAISIPATCLLTAAQARTNRDYGPHFPASLPDRDALCLVLLAEACAGAASPWAPYISALPQTYSDPTWWCADDAALLTGSRLGASADAAWAHVLRLTEAARALEDERLARGAGPGPLSDVAVRAGAAATTITSRLESVAAARGWRGKTSGPWGLSPAGAAWARSTVWSRAFNLPPVGSGAAALLPVADLMDHDPSACVAWWMDDGDGGDAPQTFTWAARAHVAAGRPLMMNYSPYKSTEELIAGYGFALPNNPADFFHVYLGVRSEDGEQGGGGGAAARAAALLRAAGLPRDVFMRVADPLPRSALAAASLVLAHPAVAAGVEAALGGVETTVDGPSPPSNTTTTTVEVGPHPASDRLPSPPPARGACDLGLPAPPVTQLAAVKSLRAALRARAGQLGGGGGGGGSSSVARLRAASVAHEAAAAAAERHHAAMAHTYLAGQYRLAASALEKLEGWAAAVVAAAAEAAADLRMVVDGAGGGGGGASTADSVGAAPQPGSSLEPRWAWGLRTPDTPTRAGAVLVEVPASEVIRFSDRGAAVAALAGAAAALGVVPPGAVPPSDPAFPPEIARHLFSAVPPPPAATVLVGGPEGGAAEALEGTPAGGALSADLEDGGVDKTRAATLARSWAGAVVDRAAWPGPGGSGLAFVRTAWAVPPAVRGVAADLQWDDNSGAARLVSACALPASTTLCRALELPGLPAGDVVAEFGPAALAVLTASPPAALHPTLGGPNPTLYAFEVDAAPDEPAGGPATTLLDAAGLSGSHWFAAGPTARGRARRFIAALAVMGSEPAMLESAGSGRLLAARAAAADAWSAAPDSGRDGAVKADAAADAEATAFVATLLAQPGVAATAARAARSVLAGEREALVADASADAAGDAAKGAACYRAGLVAALDAALAEVGAALKEAKRANGAEGKVTTKKKKRKSSL